VPGRREVGGGQGTLDGAGLVARGRPFAKLGDELIECAGPGFGLLAERNRDLASRHTCVGLPFAESAYVRNRSGRQCHGFRRVDLCVCRRRLVAAWQQYADDAQPECQPQKKEHDQPVSSPAA